ncbi:MAG: murein biosynthesis integral membrane protein MurJ [Elusimicrobia bacterium]|nr:murein biosynthesis integral membrane protein MurJ [Elusimicrobiota bacterium]
MGRNFSKFFGATLISRVFGYLRDLSIAHFVGGGGWADLYFATFRLANLLRNLVGEGGLYAAYTPVYAPLVAQDKEDAARFAGSYAGRLAAVLAVIVGLGILFAEPLTRGMLLGFSADPEKMVWAVTLTKILLPFLLFVTLAAWAQATLQAHNKFFWSSLSPAFASIAIIAYFLMSRSSAPGPRLLIVGLAWATTIGGFLQFAVLWPQLHGVIGRLKWRSFWAGHPELKKSLLLFGPYTLTFSLDQVNGFVGTFFGSFAEAGTIAALYNSSRLIQLPLGLVGVGSLVTALPLLSQEAQRNDRAAVRRLAWSQAKRMLMFEIPAILAFIFFGELIIRLLYFHGRFQEQALYLTAKVLAVSSPTLLFYSLQKIFLGLFYAHRDTKSLVLTSVLQLFVSASGCFLLLESLGAVGIGLAFTGSSLVGLVAMFLIVKKKNYL